MNKKIRCTFIFDQEGSVIIITGASSGLGKELALAYSRRKIKLVITGRDIHRLNSTKKECTQNGNLDVKIFVGDITNPLVCKFFSISL
jgi:short-subunit dehydrogenase